jgi:hypothetical protein
MHAGRFSKSDETWFSADENTLPGDETANSREKTTGAVDEIVLCLLANPL